MKFALSFLILLAICLVGTSHCSNSLVSTEGKYLIRRYINFARLTYVQSPSVTIHSCSSSQSDNIYGYKVVDTISHTVDNVRLSIVISKKGKELVFAFGGPKATDIELFRKVFQSGFFDVPELGGLTIEEGYWKIYDPVLRTALINAVSTLGSDDTKYVFVGHSFGGALAMIVSYDLVHNNFIKKGENGPFVYTYGALRIGTSTFVNTVQSYIGTKIVRIRRNGDFFTLMPRCVYDSLDSSFRCYRTITALVTSFPRFSMYYLGYNPVVRRKLMLQIPTVIRPYLSAIKTTKVEVRQTSSVTSKQNTETRINLKENRQLKNIAKSESDRLTNYTPLPYNANKSKKTEVDRPKDSTPLPYKTSTKDKSKVATKKESNNRKKKVSKERLASHKPLKHSSRSSDNDDSDNQSSSKNKKAFNSMRTRSFLETKVEAFITKGYFKHCIPSAHFITCKYNPIVHQTYYGINIERC